MSVGNLDKFFSFLVEGGEALKSSGPAIIKNLLLVFSVAVLHFATFLSAFDPNLSILLDAGALSRFLIGGFFLYSIVFALVIVGITLVFGREVSPLELLRSNYESADARDAQKTVFGFLVRGSSRAFTHLIALSVFTLKYIGLQGCRDLLIVTLFLAALYFVVGLFRSAINSIHPEVETGNVDGIWGAFSGVYLAIAVVCLAMLSGEFRARFVAENYQFTISSSDPDFVNVYSVFLTSQAGLFLFEPTAKSVIFVPWDSEPVITAVASKRRIFGLVEAIRKKFILD